MTGWPWPLDGAQDWFEGLWNWVSEATNSAAAWLYDQLRPLFDAVQSGISGAVSQLQAWVAPLFGPLLAWGTEVVDAFWTSLQAFTQDPVGFLSGALDTVKTALATIIADLPSQIMAALQSAGAWLGDAAAWLSNTIFGWFDGLGRWLTDSFKWLQEVVSENASWVAGEVKTMFDGAMAGIGDAFAGAIGGLQDMILGAFQAIGKWFMEQVPAWFMAAGSWLNEKVIRPVWEGLKGLWDWIVGAAKGAIDSVSDYITGVVDRLRTDPLSVMGEILLLFGGAGLAATGITSVMGIKVLGTGIEVGEIGSYIKDFINPGMISSVTIGTLLGATIGEAVMQYARRLAKLQFPSVGDATRMLWRALIDQGQFLDLVDRAGFDPGTAKAYLALTDNIPGAGDLITFVVREVITFQDFQVNMLYQGYNAFWSKAYWDAHWVLPAFEQAVDAYHRGILSREELDRFIVWHDYSPEPRPGIGKSDQEILRGLIKTQIGRVDVRRGWELGAISDEDLLRRYEYLGYEEDAPLMAEIQKRTALDAEIGKLRDNAKADYVKGYLDEATFRATLRDLGYPDTLTNYHFWDAREDQERKFKDDQVDAYEDAYVKELLTDADLEARLSEILVRPEIVELRLERAYIRKYKKPKPIAPEKIKVLPLDTVKRAFREAIISEDELRAEILARDYSEEDADVIIAIEKTRVKE